MFDSKFLDTLTTAIKRGKLHGPIGVRARLLAIALIPSIALLGIGVGASVYLVNNGKDAENWAELASATAEPSVLMIEAFQLERGASILFLAGDPAVGENIAATRKNSDNALAALQLVGENAVLLRPDLKSELAGYTELYEQLPILRAGIDARALPSQQVFLAFSTVIDTIVQGSLLAAEVAPDAKIAVDLYKAIHPLRAAEAVSRAGSIGSQGLLTNQFSAEQLTEFIRYVGDARGEMAFAAGTLTGDRKAQLKAILDGQSWQQLTAMEDAVVRRGVVTPESDPPASRNSASGSTSNSSNNSSNNSTGGSSANAAQANALPLGFAEWGTVAAHVRSDLLKLWEAQSREAHRNAMASGEETASNSLYGGIAVGFVTLLAFVAALFLANRLIRRMRRLRRETLELADQRLPEAIKRLSSGRELDEDADLAPLDFGKDEIGQVADAFNRAHAAAVVAAVAEAKTREGVNAVFLNIAHRSQVMVHRQLALLDRAEREEENASKLDVLFQLDHLATRSRRNAENLIILGGEKPGRRWRNPVPLIDVVRSAVAESLDYTRINTGKLPDLRITGGAVADLIHLLAELTDNATAFSPPQSRVAISGNQVGRGVALEIADQGLGMSTAELAERNALLTEPPDFSVAALSTDARLGLFVVAKLSQRHGISVRLAESDYGGIKAIVLVPTALIATGSDDEPVERRPAIAAPPPQPTFAPAAVSTVTAGMANTERTIAMPPSGGEKPALPRRRRAAEEAAAESAAKTTRSVTMPRPRSADEARNLMSAIESGTRQGRLNRVEIDNSAKQSDRQEGAGDNLQAP
ncbi:nitrate- and nitrite sensing domain-containing protein [Nocardia sp. NBC_01377]|uniref:sensor histidine kinase n=1 Tax=Nocardia sp. NBC_01377 TaxID=2903595 RepID=UPI003243244F